MFTSFSTALSALAAQSTAIDVVGNNLANLNTPGFKSSVVSFHDLVTQSLGAGLGDTQVGFGVGTPITLRQFSQGAIQTTGGTLVGCPSDSLSADSSLHVCIGPPDWASTLGVCPDVSH